MDKWVRPWFAFDKDGKKKSNRAERVTLSPLTSPFVLKTTTQKNLQPVPLSKTCIRQKSPLNSTTNPARGFTNYSRPSQPEFYAGCLRVGGSGSCFGL
ncbi:jg23223 [Pararge aegeria aegeria]|uniref:Jg23223 protein n=1 Tax=Pararge aegeria aegeria TaxID=348720 RepID=A0A8S4RLI2_9NEOP|nr:jg23223 [Pararge aegeria aegeria]